MAPPVAKTDPTEPIAAAIEKSHSHASFPRPLAQAGGRERWEMLLALLLGRQPVLGRMRAQDAPFSRKGEAARELAVLLGQTPLCLNWNRRQISLLMQGQPEQNKDGVGRASVPPLASEAGQPRKSRDRVLPASVLASLVGLLALEESIGWSEKDRDANHMLLIRDLVRSAKQLGPALTAALAVVAGIPTHELSADPDCVKNRPFSRLFDMFKALDPDQRAKAREKAADAKPGWWSLHLSAQRIHSGYIHRFSHFSVQAGASSFVLDLIACLREGFVDEASEACLMQDLGGHLVFLLPEVVVHRNGHQSREEWVRSTIQKILQHALSSPEGWFASRYPAEWSVARQKALDSRGMDFSGLQARGLFPDLLIEIQSVELLDEVQAAIDNVPSDNREPIVDVHVPGDTDLLHNPPVPDRNVCYGCHLERGVIQPPHWEPDDEVCPGCALIIASGQRMRQEALAGIQESLRSIPDVPPAYGRCLFPSSAKKALSGKGVTIHLDGDGVGKAVRRLPLLRRPVGSQTLEHDLRTRYARAIAAVTRKLCAWPAEAYVHIKEQSYPVLPLEVLWIGGDDICVCLHPDLAQPFLEGFLEQKEGLKFSGGVLVHGMEPHEKVRVTPVLAGLLEEAKLKRSVQEPERAIFALALLPSVARLAGVGICTEQFAARYAGDARRGPYQSPALARISLAREHPQQRVEDPADHQPVGQGAVRRPFGLHAQAPGHRSQLVVGEMR